MATDVKPVDVTEELKSCPIQPFVKSCLSLVKLAQKTQKRNYHCFVEVTLQLSVDRAFNPEAETKWPVYHSDPHTFYLLDPSWTWPICFSLNQHFLWSFFNNMFTLFIPWIKHAVFHPGRAHLSFSVFPHLIFGPSLIIRVFIINLLLCFKCLPLLEPKI